MSKRRRREEKLQMRELEHEGRQKQHRELLDKATDYERTMAVFLAAKEDARSHWIRMRGLLRLLFIDAVKEIGGTLEAGEHVLGACLRDEGARITIYRTSSTEMLMEHPALRQLRLVAFGYGRVALPKPFTVFMKHGGYPQVNDVLPHRDEDVEDEMPSMALVPQREEEKGAACETQ